MLPINTTLKSSQFANDLCLEQINARDQPKELLEAVAVYADLSAPLDAWYRIAKKAEWKSLQDVRRTLPSANAVAIFSIQHKGKRLPAYHRDKVRDRKTLHPACAHTRRIRQGRMES